MILKKPYAFLIKHFRIINLILLVPILYVTITFSNISTFYRNYINNNYTSVEIELAEKYVNLWLLITLITLVIINLILYGLMKKKNKPKKIYVFSIIYYFLLFIMALLFYNNLTNIGVGKSSTSTTKFFKDLSIFATIPNYLIVIFTLFKGIGFNIKTLKFDKNLDLQVTDEDNEEIEIGGNSETGGYKKSFIHIIRELKYYVIENKFIISCIGIIILLLISSRIYLNFGVYNKQYSVNQNFALNRMILSIKDSYITNTDMGGNSLGKDKYYLVVKVKIENNSASPIDIEKNNFRIVLGDKNLYPVFDKGLKFIDIAKNYQGNSIYPKSINATDQIKYSCEKGYQLKSNYCYKDKEKPKEAIKEHNYSCPDNYELNNTNCILNENNSDYVIVYELKDDEIKSKYEMKILSSIESNVGEIRPNYKIINFRPKKLLNNEDLGEFELNKEVKLKDSFLGDTSINIKNITIANNYMYEYEICEAKDNCYFKKEIITAEYGNRLVIIENKIKYDENTSYYKNSKHLFFEDFGKLVFNINNNEIKTNLKEVTPKEAKDVNIYQVSSLIDSRENLKLIITNRNKSISLNVE